MQVNSQRLNRIPRLSAKRPTLFRRLDNWLKRVGTERRVRLIQHEISELCGYMRFDAVQAAFNRKHYVKSPVLAERMAQDRARLKALVTELNRLLRALAAQGEEQ